MVLEVLAATVEDLVAVITDLVADMEDGVDTAIVVIFALASPYAHRAAIADLVAAGDMAEGGVVVR